MRADRAKTHAIRLAKELERFYATNFVSTWQKEDVKKIREEYEKNQRVVDNGHDLASSKLSDKYAQLELDYLLASTDFKEKNPRMQWHPSGIRGLFTTAFWHNIIVRARHEGITFGSYAKKS